MATSIILTSRLPFLEKLFRGLNHVYIKHHLIGSVSFILLLIHPLVLAIRYLQFSTADAARFLLPSLALWPKALGNISLGIMMILLFITFYLAWRYRTWKFSHRFLVLAFFLAFLHTSFITSDTSANIYLKAYLLGLGALAFIAYGYRLLVEFGHYNKLAYIVSGTRPLSADVLEISLKPVSTPIQYEPGQFAFLSVQEKPFSNEEHPYSFVSKPDDTEIKFAIKAFGEYTKSLTNLKIGSLVFIEGPYGTFGQGENLAEREIWIAGGIGITPFASIARDWKRNGRQADLYMCSKTPGDTIYLPELTGLTQYNTALKVIPYYSVKDGRLSANKVEELSGPLTNRQIYICGPVALMQSLRKQFILKGVKDSDIHSEEFNLI
jgi:predicted ferric reductase